MTSSILHALLFMASFVLSTATAAQTAYKCGDSYSQTPCAGGVAIDASDRRSSEQKLQADLATRRDARSADAMEQARLAQEQTDLAANTPKLKPADAASSTSQAQKKKKRAAADTAQGAGGHKKKPVAKKRKARQDARKSRG